MHTDHIHRCTCVHIMYTHHTQVHKCAHMYTPYTGAHECTYMYIYHIHRYTCIHIHIQIQKNKEPKLHKSTDS